MNSTHPGRRTAALLLSLTALIVLLASCSDDGLTQIELPVASLEVVNGCEFMAAGESCQIVVDAFTDEGQRLSNPILRYQTTTPNVLIVSDDGLVTARVAGEGFVLVQSTTGSAMLQLDIRVVNPSSRNDDEG